MGKVIAHASSLDIQAVAARVVVLMGDHDFDIAAWFVANGISYVRDGHALNVRLESTNGLCVIITTVNGVSTYPLKDDEIFKAADLIVRTLDIKA